jgi:magnesium transporter
VSEKNESQTKSAKSLSSQSKKTKKAPLFGTSRAKKFGLPPGTPVHIGTHRDFEPIIHILSYDPESLHETKSANITSLPSLLKDDGVNWVNVEGIHDVQFVQSIGSVIELHPLTQEDIVNSALRPQFDSYPNYFFFSLKMLYLSPDKQLVEEHTSLILKGNTIVVFQETPGDVFESIRSRIHARTGRVRSRGADYLLYLMIDAIVDGYYQVVDDLAERLDGLEEDLTSGMRDNILSRIFEIRREILLLRKNIVPVRDLLGKAQVERTVFQENTKVFLSDLTAHITQVSESLALSMDMSNVLLETYHSLQNQRMNGVMKTLTMISTIFLPLNFIAGIYGMNFDYLPELRWYYGYPLTLGAMAMITAAMLTMFVRKGWLWETRSWTRSLRGNIHRS